MLGGAAVAGTVGYGVTGAYRFEIERIGTALPGLRAPVTLAWLADLHYGLFIRAGSVAAWLDGTLELAPDVIGLGGDTVDDRAPRDITPLLMQLARLPAPPGVNAFSGNHEALLYRDAGQHRAFEGRPLDGACLLAAHGPRVLPGGPPEVDLPFCGRTHVGQAVLPRTGPLVGRSGLCREFVAGWVRAPGLGVTQEPIRMDCLTELKLATLTPDGRTTRSIGG